MRSGSRPSQSTRIGGGVLEQLETAVNIEIESTLANQVIALLVFGLQFGQGLVQIVESVEQRTAENVLQGIDIRLLFQIVVSIETFCQSFQNCAGF